MIQTARREAILLRFGFVFQVFGAAALLLAPSVQAGEWILNGSTLAILVPLFVWGTLAWFVHGQLNQFLPDRDPLLFPSAMFLAGWGLQILVRLAPTMALRQTLWLVLACLLLVLLTRLPHDLEWLRNYRYLWIMAALLALGATFFIGISAAPNSPKLWLGLDGIFFQPSEFLRWIFPVFAAFTLAPKIRASASSSWKRALPVILFGAISVALLLLQQDLGVTMLLFASIILVLFLAFQKRIVLAVGAAAGLLAGTLSFWFDGTVRARILTWWNPWLDASNTSYQVVQSLIAAAAGGIIGRGPGLGSPWLVPVAFSDFLFAALSEEYGVVGALGCLMIISVLVLRGLRIAARSPELSGGLLAGSLSTLLGLQSILIIGGVLRLLPLTGITLPWMSYGGSSLISNAIVLALLLVLSAKTTSEPCAPQSVPSIQILAGAQILAVLAAAVSLGWWGIYRAPVLRTRTDNARRIIHDLQARRGNLYDRNGVPLASTEGIPGEYIREYPDPAMAPVVGYSSALYGQGGMEAALDPWLRGESSHDTFEIWWSETVLGIPAEGSAARLTIDRSLQDIGADLLRNHSGAIVVLRVRSGEILALVSEPTFNPATLEQDWDQLLENTRSPLLNRATQGLYPPGRMLLPFLTAEALDEGMLLPSDLLCSSPLRSLALEHPDLLTRTLGRFRFDQAPVMDLPTAHSPLSLRPADTLQFFSAAGGEHLILLSPMQIALALSSLAADGTAPAPTLVRSLETPSGWIAPSAPNHPVAMITSETALRIMDMLRATPSLDPGTVEIPLCTNSIPQDSSISWYAGFQSYGEDGIVVVVVSEEGFSDVGNMGRLMLERATDVLLNSNTEPLTTPPPIH